MKRLLLLLTLCLMATPISAAFTQNFQDTTGYTTLGGSTQWTWNTTGGNNYITFPGLQVDADYLRNTNPEQTTYAAFSVVKANSADVRVVAYDSALNPVCTKEAGSVGKNFGGGVNTRFEMKYESGGIHFYTNGVEVFAGGVGGTSCAAIASAPSYFGVSWFDYIDDYTYGTTSQRVVYDMPPENLYYLKKDLLNPASSGFYNATTDIVAYSNYLPSSWSKDDGANETIVLANVYTGDIVETHYTGTRWTGDESWDIATSLIAADAPYGFYETYMPNRSSTHSTPIIYKGGGAALAFDKDDYSTDDTATITYTVENDYWSAITSPEIKIIDIYGTEVFSESLLINTGSVEYQWQSDDEQGVYYAELIGTYESEEVILNIDWTEVATTFGVEGFVLDAETTLPIEGANVSYEQGSTTASDTSGYDGNYSVSGLTSGISLWANASATGYSPNNFTFTVQRSHTIPRNISLNATTPTYTGAGIGGVHRDGNLVGFTITGGYGRPIPGATANLKNTTNGDYCTNTSNLAGWYKFDESNGCMLTSGRLYDVWSTKIGYANSPNYTVVAA